MTLSLTRLESGSFEPSSPLGFDLVSVLVEPAVHPILERILTLLRWYLTTLVCLQQDSRQVC